MLSHEFLAVFVIRATFRFDIGRLAAFLTANLSEPRVIFEVVIIVFLGYRPLQRVAPPIVQC